MSLYNENVITSDKLVITQQQTAYHDDSIIYIEQLSAYSTALALAVYPYQQ